MGNYVCKDNTPACELKLYFLIKYSKFRSKPSPIWNGFVGSSGSCPQEVKLEVKIFNVKYQGYQFGLSVHLNYQFKLISYQKLQVHYYLFFISVFGILGKVCFWEALSIQFLLLRHLQAPDISCLSKVLLT